MLQVRAMTTQTISDLLSTNPVDRDRPAIVELTRDAVHTVSRGELLDSAGRLSAGLVDAGLERGDRVAIIAPNGVRWIVSALGVIQAGGVLVPLDTQMPDEDLAHALVDAAPRWLFTTSALAERLPKRDALVDVRRYRFDAANDESDAWSHLLAADPGPSLAQAGDLATIFYTSGTTGPPKGVPLTHGNLASNIEALCAEGMADGTDRVLVPLPFHHVYPFTVGILVPLSLGATIIVPFSLVGPQIVRALHDGEASIMLGVPRLFEAIWTALAGRVADRGRVPATLFRVLLALSIAARSRLGWRLGRRLFASLHRRLGSSLRLMVSGGAALDPALGRRLQGLGWDVATGYGLSETSPILTLNRPDRIRLESAGLPLANVELRIAAADGPGEVLARGPNVFGGYWQLPEKTAKVLDEQGWFRTGDLGRQDADGYLHLQGRASAMIVLSGGENIDPERVEKALGAADEIREAGVLAHGDRLAAVIVPEDQVVRATDDAAALRERVAQAMRDAARGLPSHHRPGILRVALDPLPRTRLGKLRRHKLEALFARLATEDLDNAAMAAPIAIQDMSPEDQQLVSDPAAEGTWRYLAERFSDRRLTPDTSLALDLDIDSLGWVELTLALRDRASIELEDAAIARVETVRDLLREAAASTSVDSAGEDLITALADPERVLNPEQRAWLAPRGATRTLAARLLLGLSRLTTRLLIRLDVQGRIPAAGPYLVAPRHLSSLDPVMLAQVVTARQLDSIYWAGWTGILFANRVSRWFSRVAQVLPIDPGAAPRASLALGAACLDRGFSLVWFPEGRRSEDGSLQAFRPGVGLLLRAHPVPVIPVWIEGTREAMPPGRWFPRPGRVRILIGDPIPVDELGGDEREIVRLIEKRVAALGAE